jgi:hypothetical protein
MPGGDDDTGTRPKGGAHLGFVVVHAGAMRTARRARSCIPATR